MGFIVFGPGVNDPIKLDSTRPRAGVAPVQETPAVTAVSSNEERAGAKEHLQREASRAYEANESQPRDALYYAADIMHSPLITAPLSTTLAEALVQMNQHRIAHLPLVDAQDRIRHLVHERDLLRLALSRSRDAAVPLRHVPAREAAEAQVICASEDTEIHAILKLMLEKDIPALPITDASQRGVGMLSRTDILAALRKHPALEKWA